MRAVHKRYLRELMTAMATYVLLVFFAKWALHHVESLPLRALVAVSPMLPIALTLRAMFRVILGQDELERRIDLESIALAAAATAAGFLGYGLLMNADVVPHADGDAVALWVFPALMGGFGLGKCLVVARRYRGGGE